MLIRTLSWRLHRSRAGRKPPGFTLIEMLVCISIVAILVALATPQFARARGAARAVVCLANLRQVAVAFHRYHSSFDAYPFAHGGTWISMTPPEESDGAAVRGGHWDLDHLWPGLFHDVAPWRENIQAWRCPGARRAPKAPWVSDRFGTLPSSYWYSNSFIARPELWRAGAVPDESLLRPIHESDVYFPAGKVLLYDGEMAHVPPDDSFRLLPVLFADDHAEVKDRDRADAGVANPFTGEIRAFHSTRDGVRGADFH